VFQAFSSKYLINRSPDSFIFKLPKEKNGGYHYLPFELPKEGHGWFSMLWG